MLKVPLTKFNIYTWGKDWQNWELSFLHTCLSSRELPHANMPLALCECPCRASQVGGVLCHTLSCDLQPSGSLDALLSSQHRVWMGLHLTSQLETFQGHWEDSSNRRAQLDPLLSEITPGLPLVTKNHCLTGPVYSGSEWGSKCYSILSGRQTQGFTDRRTPACLYVYMNIWTSVSSTTEKQWHTTSNEPLRSQDLVSKYHSPSLQKWLMPGLEKKSKSGAGDIFGVPGSQQVFQEKWGKARTEEQNGAPAG